MKFLALALVMVASSALAGTAGYDLKMDLSMNGKRVSSPQMIVKAGEMATFNQSTERGERFLEVIATDEAVQSNKGILMKFTVGYVSKDGKRTIVSQPQILAMENQRAEITVGDKNGETVSLSVLAKRKAL